MIVWIMYSSSNISQIGLIMDGLVTDQIDRKKSMIARLVNSEYTTQVALSL